MPIRTSTSKDYRLLNTRVNFAEGNPPRDKVRLETAEKQKEAVHFFVRGPKILLQKDLSPFV